MKIGLLFGGRSYEHDISIITAVETAAALSVSHEVIPIYAADGCFYRIKGKLEIASFANGTVHKKKVSFFSEKGKSGIKSAAKKIPLDCVVCCCHGGEGENGEFSALLDVFDFAYTASDPLSSALSMNKKYSKLLFKHCGFESPAAVFAFRGEDAIERAATLSYPLIVKPCSLGSSLGVGVAHNEIELIEKVAVAFEFDEEILIEEVVQSPVELNCAAFRKGGEIFLSAVERPITLNEILTFRDKYEGGKYKGSGQNFVGGELRERVRAATKQIYKAFGLFGVARVDFLYDEKKDVLFVNEINSQPGSLAYYLFEEERILFPALLDGCIEEAIRRRKEKGIIKFNSGVLDNLSVKTVK